jgi:hypothetical protein
MKHFEQIKLTEYLRIRLATYLRDFPTSYQSLGVKLTGNKRAYEKFAQGKVKFLTPKRYEPMAKFLTEMGY